jgi:hypothetical protein
MKARFLVPTLIILFVGCAAMMDHTPVVHSDLKYSQSERDEASVYKSIIEAMYVQRGVRLIVVRDKTVPGNSANGQLNEQVRRAANELPLSPETVSDFLQKNSDRHPLIKSLKLDVDVKQIDESESNQIFLAGTGWEEFYKKYPSSQGVLEVSKPGFNKDATQALVYVANQGSWKSGAGYYVLLLKSNSSWKIAKSYTSWVS